MIRLCAALLAAALLTACPGPSTGNPDAGSSDGGGTIDALHGGVAGFDLRAVTEEGYWYSRYNLGALVMMSGMGETFMPPPAMPDMLVQMVSDTLSTAVAPKNPALLKRVYNAANPAYLNASNGDAMDFTNDRWTAAVDKNTTLGATGWTILKEIEWGKQFHVDSHFGIPGKNDKPGAQERFAGLVLYAEAVNQAMEFANNPTAFDMSDVAGNYVMLAALSDISLVTRPTALPHSTSNRMRMVAGQMATMMGMPDADALAKMIEDKADALYKTLPAPSDMQGLSSAVVSLPWYGSAIATNRAEVKTKIATYADQIAALPANDLPARARAVRALLDAGRITGAAKYKTAASGLFAALVADYQGKTGSFKSSSRLTCEDIAWTVGALAATLHLGSAAEAVQAEKVLTGFFEAAVDISGVQISAPPVSYIPAYEKLSSDLFHRYPTTPQPRSAGGPNGIAPVYGSDATFDAATGKWKASKDRFDVAGGMHLANVMLWIHVDEVDGYPKIP